MANERLDDVQAVLSAVTPEVSEIALRVRQGLPTSAEEIVVMREWLDDFLRDPRETTRVDRCSG